MSKKNRHLKRALSTAKRTFEGELKVHDQIRNKRSLGELRKAKRQNHGRLMRQVSFVFNVTHFRQLSKILKRPVARK